MTEKPVHKDPQQPSREETEGDKRAADARMFLDQDVQAAMALHAWPKEYAPGGLEVGALSDALEAKLAEFRDGNDLKPLEQMLYSQALALQGIFSTLSVRAAEQKTMSHYQAHLTLALKAQAQCRATLTAIAEIRNPRQVAFVKQANIANNQQVNNGVASPAPEPARARKTEPERSKLLERHDVEWLDPGTQSAAIPADSPLEPMEVVHRAKDPQGQSEGGA